MDIAQPCHVGVQTVHRNSEQLAADGLESRFGLGKADELARTDRREVGRMREQEQPTTAVVAQGPLAACRAGGEARCGVPDAQWLRTGDGKCKGVVHSSWSNGH